MKLSVILKTVDYRGDHITDVSIAYELKVGETVVELAERLLKHNNLIRDGVTVIEIREIVGDGASSK